MEPTRTLIKSGYPSLTEREREKGHTTTKLCRRLRTTLANRAAQFYIRSSTRAGTDFNLKKIFKLSPHNLTRPAIFIIILHPANYANFPKNFCLIST